MVRILSEIRNAPEKIAGRSLALREAARRRVHEIRFDGARRLLDLQLGTLQNVEKLLDEAPELPVVSRGTGAANRLVQRGIVAVRTPPIPDYDELNVKQVLEHLDQLGTIDLLRVRSHEAGGKGRKTILDGVEREIARRSRLLAS